MTRGAQVAEAERAASLAQAPLWGLGKVVALEHPELACRLIDLDGVGLGDPVGSLVGELLAGDAEDQVALRDGRRLVPRLVRSGRASDRLALSEGEDYRLEKGADGTLEGLRFDAGAVAPPGVGEVQVQVRAAGLNFRDVLDVLGMVAVRDGSAGGRVVGGGGGRRPWGGKPSGWGTR